MKNTINTNTHSTQTVKPIHACKPMPMSIWKCRQSKESV